MCDAGVLKHNKLIGNFKGDIVMVRLGKECVCKRSLTVKETMLETRVDKAEGMNVSCLGIGLIRRPTFCTAVAGAFSTSVWLEICGAFAQHLTAPHGCDCDVRA